MRFFVLCFLVAGAFLSFAQQQVSGKIVRQGDNQPVADASIFLTNTTFGTTSLVNGTFVLSGVPEGSYTLVVSCIGFETYRKDIALGSGAPIRLNIALQKQVVELAEVSIYPFDKNGWKHWGKLFLETFIGTTPNARQTKLLNPKVLRFRYNKTEGTLQAVADEPLLISNKALGYQIAYTLEDFRMNFNTKVNFFSGYPYFREMKARPSLQKRFLINRKNAYTASTMRFIRSLYNDSLKTAGYDVHRMKREPNLEKMRVRKLPITDSVTYPADSIRYFERVMRQEEVITTVSPALLTTDSLLTIEADGTKRLYFDDYLQVVNTQSYADKSYQEWSRRSLGLQPQVSLVQLLDNGVTIDPYGNFYPTSNIVTGFYWGWSNRIADLLPLDYK